MKKLLKNKMIIIGTLVAIVIVMVIVSAIKQFEAYKFKDWIYNTYVAVNSPAIKMDPPHKSTIIIIEIILAIIWGVFIGLAFKYAKSNSPKKQGRKWPYIVMLIYSVVLIGILLFSIAQEGHGVITLDDKVAADVHKAVFAKLSNSYGIIFILVIIGLIIDIAALAASILGLVIISKMKAEKDMQMTDAVLQTGIEDKQSKNHNDLP